MIALIIGGVVLTYVIEILIVKKCFKAQTDSIAIFHELRKEMKSK